MQMVAAVGRERGFGKIAEQEGVGKRREEESRRKRTLGTVVGALHWG
jgi:hypothetical protein